MCRKVFHQIGPQINSSREEVNDRQMGVGDIYPLLYRIYRDMV